ncbi:H-NS family nucleoid-associated regulatory protein [Paraburkholderia sp. BCC1885]|uniref:H-NS family nucleoid-associated regulatory protein n=1 Tax=Paraburkholderia sp. BCC1885 TaxID=2562669 RepID=UPI001182433F|nr:H-NS family nucleoid-associated regulatory protein [Paraburkholderia sp. BCC1885]
MATLENIQARIAKLQTQAEALIRQQSSGVLEKIRELVEKHGITTADIEAHIGGKKRGRRPGESAVAKPGVSSAKYRDPKTGATWTGHGRAPVWIASVKDRSKFLVDGVSSNSAPAAKRAAEGNYVRGPQPPKYRDPKTGATWSGRGPAPAWLAGAGEDRARYLITETRGRATKATSQAPGTQATAKKSAAKTGPGRKLPAKKSARAAVTAAEKPVAANEAAK